MGFFLTFLLYAALFVLSELIRPKPDLENAKPSGLGDFRVTTATEGRVVPLVWGTVRIDGPNIIWYGDLIQQAIKKTIKTGLFSSEEQTIGFRYFLGIQSALCMGPLDGPDDGLVGVTIGDAQVRSATGLLTVAVSAAGSGYAKGDLLTVVGGTFTRAAIAEVASTSGGGVATIRLHKLGYYSVFPSSPAATTALTGSGTGCTVTITTASIVAHNGTFTINKTKLFGGEELGQGGVVGTFRFFGGTSTQAVSTYLSAFQKEPPVTGSTPAYKDICYVAPDTAPPLLGTSTSIKGWKWEVRRIPNGLSLSAANRIVAGGANIANVFYEVLTSADWGYGVAAADIDTTNFTTAGNTLASEGNGFSFLLDREEDASDMIRRLEEQADCVLFLNPLTAKWQLKLIRDDYDILLVPEVSPATNRMQLLSFTRNTFDGTSNQVRTPFHDPTDEYKSSYGFAQDMANALIVGSNTSATVTHPGVKDRELANALAWRELRTLAIPLAISEFVVDRSLYGVLPGDVVGFTDSTLGFVRLPMRIKAVDYGDLLDGKIRISATQDVFFAAAGVFGVPPSSGWTPLAPVLVAFPTAEQLAFEAPRALTFRDPNTSDPEVDKVWAAARKQSSEVAFEIHERHAAGTPSGSFTRFGKVYQFMLIGDLDSALSISATQPQTSFLVVPDPDTQADINNAFPAGLTVADLGVDLATLCLIDDEFMLPTGAQTSASNVQLDNVYRGVLDSVQADHLATAKVYLVFVGGGMSDTSLPAGDNVEIKLLPESAAEILDIAEATAISFTMDNRTRRPYPPASFDLNGVTLDTTSVDLDGSGSGENVGILVDGIVRRDFRTTDEVASLLTDAAVINPTFPSAHTTEVEIEIRNGVTVLTTTTGISGTSATMRQLDILAGLDTTSLPSSLTIAVRQSHTLASVVYKSRDYFVLVFTVASPFVGKTAFGELDENEESAAFTVVAPTVDHVFNLSTSFTVGDVEYRINGGSWLTLIAAGGTGPGTIPNASLSSSDLITVRHTSTDTSPQKLLTMTVSGTEEAYGVLIS